MGTLYWGFLPYIIKLDDAIICLLTCTLTTPLYLCLLKCLSLVQGMCNSNLFNYFQPQLTRRNTRINLEWRIRNLPYPIETYSISANNDENCIIVRTSNKKYFKKLEVPELARLNIPLEQANIQANHQYNTLIILVSVIIWLL